MTNLSRGALQLGSLERGRADSDPERNSRMVGSVRCCGGALQTRPRTISVRAARGTCVCAGCRIVQVACDTLRQDGWLRSAAALSERSRARGVACCRAAMERTRHGDTCQSSSPYDHLVIFPSLTEVVQASLLQCAKRNTEAIFTGC